ncbi:MAG: hypothetical protein EP330_29150 [Deltaproteobacteria bacterium]|nr:MAG: hypothetical protein EP330_29150 [Deltaproteobacteria bacterium]
MSLIALIFWLTTAWAGGSVVWLSEPPDPELAPDLTRVPRQVVAPEGGIRQEHIDALENLRVELEAVRPLVHEFDGELEIMARLQAAIDDVEVLRDGNDRDLLYSALAFQGFAVRRYFQDQLATEPAAAPYRLVVGGTVEVRPWVDAVALDPERKPKPEDIAEEPELRAFDEARARVKVAPQATVVLAELPHSAALRIDGSIAPAGLRVRVTPGKHYLAIVGEEGLRSHSDVRMAPGGEFRMELPPSERDLVLLAVKLREAPTTLTLESRIAAAFARLPPTAHVAVRTGDGSLLYRIDENLAIRAASTGVEPSSATTRAPKVNMPGDGLEVGTHVALGWLYDPHYLLENANSAPHESSTVNAVAPVIGGRVSMHLGPGVFGGGLDLAFPSGAHHTLPVGVGTWRVRPHLYVSGGIPQLQLTLGALLPWHAAVGVRGELPLTETLGVQAGWIQGFGLALERPGGAEDFIARPAHTAFIGVRSRATLFAR